MKKVFKKLSVVVFAIAMLLFVVMFSSCGISEKHELAVEFLAQYRHSKEVVYVDNRYIYLNDNKIDYTSADLEYDVDGILFVSQTNIYFYTSSNDEVCIYACDHNLENSTKIHSYTEKSTVINVSMYSENEIRYTDNNGKNIYYIKDKKTEPVSDFPAIPSKYDVNTKTYVLKDDFVEITNKETNEIKKISISQILELSPAKDLKEITGCFDIDYVMQNDGKIYINCVSEYIVTTFTYDFETEKLEFYDWSEAYGSVYMFFLR